MSKHPNEPWKDLSEWQIAYLRLALSRSAESLAECLPQWKWLAFLREGVIDRSLMVHTQAAEDLVAVETDWHNSMGTPLTSQQRTQVWWQYFSHHKP